MKSLQDIEDEFFDERGQKETELVVSVKEAANEMYAALERAGIDKNIDSDYWGSEEDCHRSTFARGCSASRT
jgi:hypothetical protein